MLILNAFAMVFPLFIWNVKSLARCSSLFGTSQWEIEEQTVDIAQQAFAEQMNSPYCPILQHSAKKSVKKTIYRICQIYSIYRIIIIYKICKHLHAKLEIQKSINVFLSPWHQLWQYSGKLFSSCICYHIIEPPSVKWLASAKKIPATIEVNLKITIKTRCSMLTCVAPLAQVDPRP